MLNWIYLPIMMSIKLFSGPLHKLSFLINIGMMKYVLTRLEKKRICSATDNSIILFIEW